MATMYIAQLLQYQMVFLEIQKVPIRTVFVNPVTFIVHFVQKYTCVLKYGILHGVYWFPTALMCQCLVLQCTQQVSALKPHQSFITRDLAYNCNSQGKTNCHNLTITGVAKFTIRLYRPTLKLACSFTMTAREKLTQLYYLYNGNNDNNSILFYG